MIKKEKKIEDEKVLEEQPETTKLRRGRTRNIDTDKILESAESGEEKKHKDDENLNYEEKMIKDILSENVTKLKKMAKEYKI